LKHFYLLIFSSLFFFSTFAGQKTLVVNGGDWSNKDAWNPIGIPTGGDYVYVPKGYALNVKNENLQQSDITIKVDGQIILDGKFRLGEASSVELMSSQASFVITDKNALLEVGNVALVNGDGISSTTPNITIPGPAIANKTTSVSSTGFITSDFTVLPVKFTSFTVSKAANGVSVQWTTAEEINADVFLVERSEDGRTWRTIGNVKAVGNSTNVQNYSYTDRITLNSIAYYRIRQVDSDGKFTYTDVKNITNQSNLTNTATNVTIVATGNNVIMNFSKQVKGTIVVRLISFGGQVLAQQTYSQAAQQIVFNKTNVNKGNYIVSVSNNLDLTVSKQIAL
jgi:hypothetical protein